MRVLPVILAVAATCWAQENGPEELILAGHWKRARAMLEHRLSEAPPDANAIFLMSQVRAAFGDRRSPVELAEQAVRMDGGVARYHRQLAEVQGLAAQGANLLQQIGLARRFRKEIETALALDPGDVQALSDLLEFYLVAPGIVGGDRHKAEETAGRIAGVDECAGWLARARIAEVRKSSAEMEAMLRKAAAVRPASYRAQVALGEFYLVAGRRNDAAAEALGKTAVALDPGRAPAYSVLACALAGRADWDGLDELLARAARAVPDDLTPYFRAAERLLSDGREPERAARFLRIYLTQEPEGNEPTAADARQKLGLVAIGVQ